MGLKTKRKLMRFTGGTAIVSIPAALEKAPKGGDVTIAANRLLLMDPRGEICEKALLDFLENEIEPVFWPWFKRHQHVDTEEDDLD